MNFARHNIFAGERVLITGHTGFKGKWLALLMRQYGAKVFGLSEEGDSFFHDSRDLLSGICELEYFGDICDKKFTLESILDCQPKFIFHMAAQSLVGNSICNPHRTYEVNILGTLNVLTSAKALTQDIYFINVTSDKVYFNDESGVHFKEDDLLGGLDPYSCSKSCVELLTKSFIHTYLNSSNTKFSIANVRAGNVIGGADYARDRLIPDIYRSCKSGQELVIRSRHAVRPWQHVLDALDAYVNVMQHIYYKKHNELIAFNVGPVDDSTYSVESIVALAGKYFSTLNVKYLDAPVNLVEAKLLKLDATKIRKIVGWTPRLNTKQSLMWAFEWYDNYISGGQEQELVINQIKRYQELF